MALSGSTASHLCLFRNTDTYGVTRAQGSSAIIWESASTVGMVKLCVCVNENGVLNIKHFVMGFTVSTGAKKTKTKNIFFIAITETKVRIPNTYSFHCQRHLDHRNVKENIFHLTL